MWFLDVRAHMVANGQLEYEMTTLLHTTEINLSIGVPNRLSMKNLCVTHFPFQKDGDVLVIGVSKWENAIPVQSPAPSRHWSKTLADPLRRNGESSAPYLPLAPCPPCS